MNPSVERIVLGDPPAPRSERKRIARVLAEGGLVALPTETVYGLAARADLAAAVERLREVKRRDPQLALTWHVGDRAALEAFPAPSALARRLVERYWPGPLTLVLPGVPAGLELAAREGWTGVRLPALPATARILADLPFPVVATSANLSGGEPALDADQVVATFAGALDLVLDAGPCRLRESSVVLRVGPGHFDLLRPGILDLEALRTTAGLRIGFVCTGNTCRSPMAEGIARDLVARRLEVEPARLPEFGLRFTSMGVMAGVGVPASAHAVDVLARERIDISSHLSQPALPEQIEQLDRVYALTRRHLDALQALLAPGHARHCQLLDPDGEEVPDPIGGPLGEYERTAAVIRRLIEKRLPDWV
jgi:tRNA threonylcarbamoyl adenosine modification protein (Sua5/YciO/YrdC/YwlC family)